jgi:L-fuconate dehydratase
VSPPSETFCKFEVRDVRFPTSRDRDGSDAMNPDPDYSAAYLIIYTSSGHTGHGFVFTIGRGNEVVVASIRAVEILVKGLNVEEVLSDMGAFYRRLTRDSQFRWLGPEKGVMHMGIGAVVNAVWDLYAKREGLPLWQLLSSFSPREIVDLIDFRHLTDKLTPQEALEILERATPGRETRMAKLLEEGYPAYTTSAGWLGYSDEKVGVLVHEALRSGFTHFKIKVGSDIEEDARRVQMVRELIGPDLKLSIDANQMWDVDEAIVNTKKLAVHDLYWVEEPTSTDDVFGFVEISRAVHPVKVASGEQIANRVMFKQFLSSGAIAICQIDACRVAGVNENIAVLLMAAKFGVPVCPHAGGVGLCEMVQHLAMFDYVAVSAVIDDHWIEYVDHLHEHFVDPVLVENGRYTAPRLAGSGASMHPDSIIDFGFPEGRVWSGVEQQGLAPESEG